MIWMGEPSVAGQLEVVPADVRADVEVLFEVGGVSGLIG
jgi:hypothetical protein